MTITYSRPSLVNPPKPFQNSRPSGGLAGSAAGSRLRSAGEVNSGGGEGGRGRSTVELIGQRAASTAEDGPRRGRRAAPRRRPRARPRPGRRSPPGLPSSGPAAPAWRSAFEAARRRRRRARPGSPGPAPGRDGGRRRATARAGGRGTRRPAAATRTSTIGQVTGDGMRPQARLPQAVGGDGVRLPQCRAGEDDGPRQAVEQGNVIRGQATAPAARAGQRVLAAVNARSTASKSRNCSARAMAASRVSAAPVTNAMRAVPPGSRRTRRRRLNTGSSTGPVVPDRRAPGSRAAGLAGRAAAPQESDSVGLVLDALARRAVRRRDVDRPDRLFVRGPRPAAGQEGSRTRDELRLQE